MDDEDPGISQNYWLLELNGYCNYVQQLKGIYNCKSKTDEEFQKRYEYFKKEKGNLELWRKFMKMKNLLDKLTCKLETQKKGSLNMRMGKNTLSDLTKSNY